MQPTFHAFKRSNSWLGEGDQEPMSNAGIVTISFGKEPTGCTESSGLARATSNVLPASALSVSVHS
eukprot:4783270-Pleurochrysis_carterae.AAC.1